MNACASLIVAAILFVIATPAPASAKDACGGCPSTKPHCIEGCGAPRCEAVGLERRLSPQGELCASYDVTLGSTKYSVRQQDLSAVGK